uniref:Uncharacterized protein n=1 Tax=Scleropages formosus TaxID=113540 RepID=A0A8C9VFB3_SCLFO
MLSLKECSPRTATPSRYHIQRFLFVQRVCFLLLFTQECCFLSALPCFSANVQRLKTTQGKLQQKLSRNLKSTKFFDLCSTKCTWNISPSCDSYPMKNSKEFIKELEILLANRKVV